MRNHLESEKAKFGPLDVGRNIRSLGSRWAAAAQEKFGIIRHQCFRIQPVTYLPQQILTDFDSKHVGQEKKDHLKDDLLPFSEYCKNSLQIIAMPLNVSMIK